VARNFLLDLKPKAQKTAYMPDAHSEELLSPDGQPVSRLEFETRVLYSLLLPAVRFAHKCRIPLDRVTEMATLAYLGDVRRTGVTLKESASILGKSLRTVTTISKRLREDFFAPEEEHGLPRKIEFHLAVGPQTLERLLDALGPAVVSGDTLDNAQLEAALASLLEEGRIKRRHETDGRIVYEVASSYSNLVRRNLNRRIDGLNHLFEAVLDTVLARFFDEDEQAFARALTFAAPAEGVGKVRQDIYNQLRLAASDLEEVAADEGLSDQKYSIVFCVTPVRGD